MCMLLIRVQCYDKYFEVLPDEVENAELMVEDVISHVLLDVSIRFSSNARMGLYHCSISIRAHCACQQFSLLPATRAHMELAVERSICAMLRELFGSVSVDRLTLTPLAAESQLMSAG